MTESVPPPSRRSWGCFCLCLASSCLLALGCHADPNPSDGPADAKESLVTESASALQQMREAADRSDWEQAWTLKDAVLIETQEKASLDLVAKVAFHAGHGDVTAELLTQICRLDEFADLPRIQQTLTAYISIGRFFDAIDLLREAVVAQPANSEVRRLLFDFLDGTEQHVEAAEHARALVRARAFDLKLLESITHREHRELTTKPLGEMLRLNPDDPRPLIGKAKRHFDDSEYPECIDVARQIVGRRPEFLPAHLLIGRALAVSGRTEELDEWQDALPEGHRSFADYWLTAGDWAISQGEPALARVAYGNAAVNGPDRVEPWSKLLPLVANDPDSAADENAIRRREALLKQLRQRRIEFKASLNTSAEKVVGIAERLLDLGRAWEAEAWCAVGMTLPNVSPDGRTMLQKTRGSIVKQLKRETPWQAPDRLPGFAWLDRSESIADVLRARTNSGTETGARTMPRPSGTLPVLTDRAKELGIDFFGRTADDLDEPGIRNHEMVGCGGGTIDADLDGWPDVYLCTAGGKPPLADSPPNALFRNLGGRFKNVSAHSDARDRGFSHGVAVGDVNEDGWPDLLVLNYGPNRLWINNGDGTFSDRSATWLPREDVWSTSAAIADLDGDGISDVVIANYCAGLAPSTEDCYDAKLDRVRACSPNHFPAAPDTFLRGTRSGGWEDVTKTWKATPSVLGRGLGVVAGALDPNPGVDVLVANDMTSNHFWVRASDTPFTLADAAALRGLATDGQSREQGSMGIAIDDFNFDGVMDFYVTNYELEYNTLYNSASGGWQDQTSQAELAAMVMPMVGFGTEAVDLDNDGISEIVVANGHVDSYGHGDQLSAYAQPFQVFQRQSDGRFRSVGESIASDYVGRPHVGRGLWTIDADRDGRIDLLVTHQTEAVALLMNTTPQKGKTLEIHLVAKNGSRSAVGATVEVSDDTHTWTRVVTSGDGFLCSNQTGLRFGFAASPTTIRVTWPSGRQQRFGRLAPGVDWICVEGQQPFARGPEPPVRSK